MESVVERPSSLAVWVTIVFIIIAPFENIARIEKVYYMLAILVLGIYIVQTKAIKRDFTLLLPCFVVYALITTVWSINPSAFSELFTLIVVMLFLYLQLQFNFGKGDFEKIKNAFIMQGGVLIVLCLLFGRYMDNRFWLQSATSGADPNYLSGWFIIPLCFIVERLFDRNIWFIYKIIMVAEVVCFFYFIMQSASRSGLIANVIALVICIIYTARSAVREHPFRAVALILALVLIILAGIRYMPETMLVRLLRSDSELGGRSSIWMELLDVLMEHPLGAIFGMGSGSVTYYNLYYSAAHNTFLDIWFQYGIVGFSLIVSFIVLAIKNCIKVRPYALISFTAMCILIFTLSAMTTRFVMLSLFIIGAQVIHKSEHGLEIEDNCYEEE